MGSNPILSAKTKALRVFRMSAWWLRCVLFLFPVVSKYLPQQMKNLRNWVHMQHECNTPPLR